MKAKFIKGTTFKGKIVNGGDVLDLDERDFNLFVNLFKDAIPYTEEAPAKADEPVAPAAGEAPKKGKK